MSLWHLCYYSAIVCQVCCSVTPTLRAGWEGFGDGRLAVVFSSNMVSSIRLSHITVAGIGPDLGVG